MITVNEKQQAQQLLKSGSTENAVALIEQVCESYPEDAEAFYIAGQCYAVSGQHAKAEEALNKSIKLFPGMPWTHYALGGILKLQGKQEEAKKCFRNVLAIDEKLFDAEISIVNILITQAKMQEARLILNKLIKLIPENSNIYVELSRIERENSNQDKAEYYLKKALNYNLNSIPALCGLASIYTVQARLEEAEKNYLQALKLSPGNPDIISGLASLYSYQGKHNKAEELISPLLDKGVLSFELGKVLISICKYTGRTDEAIAYLTKLLKEFPLSNKNRSYLYYELGREYDRIKNYDQAFNCYKKANDLSRMYYDENANVRNVNELIEVFNKDNLLKLPKATYIDNRPVFIIGMPRSGTSLTEQILASHPDVYAGGELQFIGRMTFDLSKTINSPEKYPRCLETITEEQLNKLAIQYSTHLSTLSDTAKRITNKMPRDFYDLGMISLLFPDAYIIHCQRNAIDNCLSIYFQNFAERGNEYSNSLKMIAGYYKQYQRLMNHWCEVLPIPVLNLKYEELVNEQETKTGELLAFCGLEWNENCLNFHKLDRTIATASFDQVRQPLYRKSIERWRNYEKYVTELQAWLNV